MKQKPRVPHVVVRALERFVEVEGVQTATVLAAQAFTSLVPLMVIVAAVSPTGGDLGDRFVDRFDLDGAPAESVKALFNDAGDTRSAITWIGVVILVVSALSFTRALQRLFERAYGVKVTPLQGMLRGLTWLVVYAGWVALLVPLRDAVADAGGIGFTIVVTSVAGFLVWLVTPAILLGRTEWRRLVPGAAVSAVVGAFVSVGSAVTLPTLLSWSAARHGLIGIAFSLQGALLVEAFVIVLGAVVGATLTETSDAE